MKRSHHTLTTLYLLVFCTMSGASLAAADSPSIKGDHIITLKDGGRLIFLPLNPTLVMNANQKAIINVFVKSGSFDQFSVQIVPTIAWALSPPQQKVLEAEKNAGVKTFAPWPNVVATAYIAYTDADSALKFQKAGEVNVVAGANTSLTLALDSLDLSEVRDILNGKRNIQVDFIYNVVLPGAIGKEANDQWQRELRQEIRAHGDLPVEGAVQALFAETVNKYSEQFGTAPSQVLQLIERVIGMLPIKAVGEAGLVKLYYDTSVDIDLTIPSQSVAPILIHDSYQGKLDLGNLCTTASYSTFVTVNDVSTVGCEALGAR